MIYAELEADKPLEQDEAQEEWAQDEAREELAGS